jgi:hypothetical protein
MFEVVIPCSVSEADDECYRRLQEDIGEDDWVNSEEQTFWQGAKLAFTDPKTYILVS